MAVPRFYSTVALSAHQTLELPAAIAHHATRVLRLESNAPIVLFDGFGGEYAARLMIDGKNVRAQIGAHLDIEAELTGEISLAQGIAAGDKMDWIVEKAVELGVKRLTPIAADRSVLQLAGGERLLKRQRRWENIARAASEQCGRNRIMAIEAPRSLGDYLENMNCGAPERSSAVLHLLCHPQAERSLAQALGPGISRIALLVGPEGGWSGQEHAMALEHGVEPVRFGRRVLRTETAGLAMAAACSAIQGWD